MSTTSFNQKLREAHASKNDEFFTTIETIEKELLQHKEYFDQLKGKTVFCNCNDTEYTDFYIFFCRYFKQIGLKKLIATSYSPEGSTPAYKLEFDGEKQIKTYLEGNGDCFSEESIKILDSADVVVTNPPFSKFRAFVDLLISHNKDFIILGIKLAAGYKNVWPWIASSKIKARYNSKETMSFYNQTELKSLRFTVWFTTLEIKEKRPLELTEKYEENKYQYYDNFEDVIEVPRLKLIPKDYNGVMGVPITFFLDYCPDQFEIIGVTGDVKSVNHLRTKRYESLKFFKKTNDVFLEKKVSNLNTHTTVKIEKPEGESYYLCSNGDLLVSKPPRVFIRLRQKTLSI